MSDAISTMTRVLDVEADDGTRDRETLSAIGDTYRERFVLRGDLDDINRAVAFTREAADGADETEASFAAWQNNLCAALQTRFRSTSDHQDLVAATVAGYLSVGGKAENDPKRHIHLQNLFGCLRVLAQAGGGAEEWDEAIRIGTEAVRLIPQDSPYSANYLANLSGAAMTKFQVTKDRADIELSISFARQAVNAAKAGGEGTPYQGHSLAQALKAAWEHGRDAAHFNEAYAACLEVATQGSSLFWLRVESAIMAGGMAADAECWTEALAAYDQAISLLPQLVSLQIGRRSREHWLSVVSDLASNAAACAIELHMREKAVELLERGRAVLVTEALGHRAAVERLREVHPDQAVRFEGLRRRLRTLDGNDPADAFGELTDDRIKVADELAALVTEIRSLDGTEGFLMPVAGDGLWAPVDGGMAVIVNVSRFRSDAIIVDEAGIRTSRLRWLTPATVRFHLDMFTDALTAGEDAWREGVGKDFAAAQGTVLEVLEWLWRYVVSDVCRLTAAPTTGAAARVWWIPTGLLSFLPLHAAMGDGQSAMDLLRSSYAFTLDSLRRNNGKIASPTAAEPLVVAMPETPGNAPLTSVAAEVAALRTVFGEVLELRGGRATRHTVVSGLASRRIAHFACHARAGVRSPSESELLLHDHDREKFSVALLDSLDLSDADLAFLSACETVRTDVALANEGISIGSSFQIAGFRHVVGTMWRVADVAAPEVADYFYTHLAGSDDADVADALHTATRRMRLKYPNFPSIWAGYVHYGR
jgi:tetratricopeptide (TPR) repeat protein